MNLADRIRQLCTLRRAWNDGPWPTYTSDARVKALKAALGELATELSTLFRGEFWAIHHVPFSVGRGKTLAVPWVCLAAADQRVSEGVFVGLFFDKAGRGVVVGMAKAPTILPDVPVPTVTRTPLTDGALDVGSQRKTNDLFVNPKEFFAESLDETALVAHLRESLTRYQEFLAEDNTAPITVTPAPRRVREAAPTPTSTYSATDPLPDLSGLIPQLAADLAAGGLLYDTPLLARLVAALIARPFVVLAGLSGTGKTRLATALAAWLGAEKALVAVGADWTSGDRLLGYPDALDPERYARTPALELLLRASSNPLRPHLLILDELNLSPIERYGSELLSGLESGEPLTLHGDPTPRGGVPAQLPLPSSLWVIGTVNVDETTHSLSPKVLDRAHVLAFDAPSLGEFLAAPRRVEPSVFAGRGSSYAPQLLSLCRHEPLPPVPALATALEQLHTALSTVGFPFGYRAALDMVRFTTAYRALTGETDPDALLDAALPLKILPRLSGSPRVLGPALDALEVLAARWPTTAQRLDRLRRHLETSGYVGFGEA